MQPDLPRIRDYADIVAVMKMRRGELGWSQLEANERAGFQDGYFAKLELPDDASGRSLLTPFSLPIVLATLGLELVPVRREPSQVDSVIIGKWKRHGSPKVKRMEKRSRDRVFYAKHREKQRERCRLYKQRIRQKAPGT